eukprot:GDKJ01024785.1.p1 GENE.GDKJ01024785.1~~GDKJ01024785.1.p1  ORF type:complete len:215 (-),score=46.47 GDKJ01024785.1:36-680(-)
MGKYNIFFMATEVLGIAILDENGSRVAVKYNQPSGDLSTIAQQKEFEKEVHLKTQVSRSYDDDLLRSKYANIIPWKNYMVYFIQFLGATLYVVSTDQDNEALMAEVTQNVSKVIVNLVKTSVNRSSLTARLDKLFILLDEVMDGKMLFEYNETDLLNRVEMVDETPHQGGASGGLNLSGTFGGNSFGFAASFGTLNFNSALEQARSAVTRQLLG